MPVNSFSFKINVPTSNIPIITSVAPTGYSPPSIIPSNAVPTNMFTQGTPGQNITIPAHHLLVTIYSEVTLYKIHCRYNLTNSSSAVGTGTGTFYYQLINLGTDTYQVAAAFYGTDGVITDTLLYSINDPITNDTVTTVGNISTKCLLIDLPDSE
jgi:hypothetical protein